MTTPNYKVGWLLPQKLAALTHFHPQVTQMDIVGLIMEFQGLVHGLDSPFHLIIDNRVVPLERILTLEELQSASPLLAHPLLQTIAMVKPSHQSLSREEKVPQVRGHVTLHNVDSLEDAYAVLREKGLDLAGFDGDFFPNHPDS